MKHLFLPVLLLAAGVVNAQLLTEDFESYAVGDYIAVSGQPAGVWSTWTSGAEGTAEDAQVSNEVAQSGTQSLKLFGGLAGGPMDILLIAGLEGSYDVTFSMFVPEGNSGYYNVQESTVPATAWAFECYLNGNGTVNYNIDGGAFVLDATYATNEWLTITHHIDTDNDLMNIYFNGEYQGQLPFDGAEIGGVNFFAAGDGITTPTYYIDDLLVDVTDEVLAAGCTDDSACNFDAAWVRRRFLRIPRRRLRRWRCQHHERRLQRPVRVRRRSQQRGGSRVELQLWPQPRPARHLLAGWRTSGHSAHLEPRRQGGERNDAHQPPGRNLPFVQLEQRIVLRGAL